jgi:membrane-associated phospholipid phosphatase
MNTLARGRSMATLKGRILGGPPLVPDRLRPGLVVLTVIAAACVTGIGFATRHSHRPVLFDRPADAFFMRASGYEYRIAVWLSHAGDPKIFVTITAVVALLLIGLGDYRAAVAAVGSVAVAVVVVEELLKPFFGRRIGSLGGSSFPSGHTTVAIALAGALVLATRDGRPLGRRLGPAGRAIVMSFALVAACSIGLAMVVLQFHYLTDVVAGVPLGLAVAGWTAVGVDTVAGRWAANRDRAEHGAWSFSRSGAGSASKER